MGEAAHPCPGGTRLQGQLTQDLGTAAERYQVAGEGHGTVLLGNEGSFLSPFGRAPWAQHWPLGRGMGVVREGNGSKETWVLFCFVARSATDWASHVPCLAL